MPFLVDCQASRLSVLFIHKRHVPVNAFNKKMALLLYWRVGIAVMKLALLLALWVATS